MVKKIPPWTLGCNLGVLLPQWTFFQKNQLSVLSIYIVVLDSGKGKKAKLGKVDGSQGIAQRFDLFKHESSSGYLWML